MDLAVRPRPFTEFYRVLPSFHENLAAGHWLLVFFFVLMKSLKKNTHHPHLKANEIGTPVGPGAKEKISKRKKNFFFSNQPPKPPKYLFFFKKKPKILFLKRFYNKNLKKEKRKKRKNKKQKQKEIEKAAVGSER